MRYKLLALALTFMFALAVMVQLAPFASAADEEHEDEVEPIIPGGENGIIVALGGAIGVYGFLCVILFMVLRKRKKKAAKA